MRLATGSALWVQELHNHERCPRRSAHWMSRALEEDTDGLYLCARADNTRSCTALTRQEARRYELQGSICRYEPITPPTSRPVSSDGETRLWDCGTCTARRTPVRPPSKPFRKKLDGGRECTQSAPSYAHLVVEGGFPVRHLGVLLTLTHGPVRVLPTQSYIGDYPGGHTWCALAAVNAGNAGQGPIRCCPLRLHRTCARHRGVPVHGVHMLRISLGPRRKVAVRPGAASLCRGCATYSAARGAGTPLHAQDSTDITEPAPTAATVRGARRPFPCSDCHHHDGPRPVAWAWNYDARRALVLKLGHDHDHGTSRSGLMSALYVR